MAAGFVPVISSVPAERPDEADTLVEVEAVAGALSALGYATETLAIDLDLAPLEELARLKPLVVFNLVESLRGDGRLAHIASAMLDHFSIAYTGARTSAYFLSNSKLTAKTVMRGQGLATPCWWLGGADVPAIRRVVIKPVDEHASLGLDAASVVGGAQARAAIAEREARFGVRFFAEEFIDGREFNIAVIEQDHGPRILPIAEMVFADWPADRPRIVDYEAKWVPESAAYAATTRRFGCEQNEPALAERLRDLTAACWRAFALTGYARIDFRVGEDGRPAIIDVNANPCLAPDAGLFAAAAEAGMAYEDLIDRIVHAATSAALKAA